MNSVLTQTVQASSHYSAFIENAYVKQRIPVWSRVVILSLLCCLLIPRGVELQLGTVMIDTSRVLLTVFAMMAASQLLSGAVILRFTPADLFMSMHVLIITFSAIYHGGSDVGLDATYKIGFDKGLETASGVFIDMGLAYFVARVAVRNLACYHYYVRIVIIVAAISAGFALMEIFTGFSYLRAAYHTFFPKVTDIYISTDKRLGLYRATAAFRVSLLFGLYCAIAFAIAVFIKPYNLKMKNWTHKMYLVFCILGVIASLSSGSWLALALSFFCLFYDRITKNIRGKWKILLFVLGSGLLFLNVVSNRGPVKIIIDILTLDPQTGYVRLAMWDCVWTLMRDYWPLGWGWAVNWPRSVDWYMWTSIDSFYAVYLVRSGIFAVLSIICFLVYCWYKLSCLSNRKYAYTNEAKGWVIGTVCLFIAAFTVDIFGNLIFATYFLLGAGQTLLAERTLVPRSNKLVHTIDASRHF